MLSESWCILQTLQFNEAKYSSCAFHSIVNILGALGSWGDFTGSFPPATLFLNSLWTFRTKLSKLSDMSIILGFKHDEENFCKKLWKKWKINEMVISPPNFCKRDVLFYFREVLSHTSSLGQDWHMELLLLLSANRSGLQKSNKLREQLMTFPFSKRAYFTSNQIDFKNTSDTMNLNSIQNCWNWAWHRHSIIWKKNVSKWWHVWFW